jgi:hypothetical protein
MTFFLNGSWLLVVLVLTAHLIAPCTCGWASSLANGIARNADTGLKGLDGGLELAKFVTSLGEPVSFTPTKEMYSVLFERYGIVECADMPTGACLSPTDFVTRADPALCNDTYVSTTDDTIVGVSANMSCLGLTPAEVVCPSVPSVLLPQRQFSNCFGGRQVSSTITFPAFSARLSCTPQQTPLVTVHRDSEAFALGGGCASTTSTSMSLLYVYDMLYRVKLRDSLATARFAVVDHNITMRRGQWAIVLVGSGDAICFGTTHTVSDGLIRAGFVLYGEHADSIVSSTNISGLVRRECVDHACQINIADEKTNSDDAYMFFIVQAETDGNVTIRADCDNLVVRAGTWEEDEDAKNMRNSIAIGASIGGYFLVVCITFCVTVCKAARNQDNSGADEAPMESIHQTNEAFDPNLAPSYNQATSQQQQQTVSPPAQTFVQSPAQSYGQMATTTTSQRQQLTQSADTSAFSPEALPFACSICGNRYPTAGDVAYHTQLRHQ